MTLRSPRLTAMFGSAVEQIGEPELQTLIDGHVGEDADLDFKTKPYEANDKGKADLASDVAAMANTRGGLIIVGIAENDLSEAGTLTPTTLRPDEAARIQQILADRVAPLPDTDVRTVASAADPAVGWTLISTAASAQAPLAVRVGAALRYSVRLGSTTRHLTEPEVAAAYRARDLRRSQREERTAEVQQIGEQRLDRTVGPWLAVTAVPELAGRFPITTDSLAAFRSTIVGRDLGSVLATGASLFRGGVGKGRLWADGELRADTVSQWAQYEFFDDGSSSLAVILPFTKQVDPDTARLSHTVNDAALSRGLVNAIHRATGHAVAADAAGELLLRARLIIDPEVDDLVIAHWDGAFSHPRGSVVGVPDGLEADALAPIEGLLQPTGFLLAAAADLGDQLAQSIGLPELGYLRQDGTVVDSAWDPADLPRLQPFVAPATDPEDR